MADILTVLFKTFIPRTGLNNNDFQVICPSSSSAAAAASPSSSTLMVGDRSITRSLLLLAAVTAASELGIKVLFFTQTQIQSLPTPLQNCTSNLSTDSLKKIKFCYPRTVTELLQQVACLHESAPPSLIIVDRLEGYLRGAGGCSSHSEFQQAEQSCAAHVSALLHDTAAFLTQVLEQRDMSSAPCRVIASIEPQLEVGQRRGELSAPDPVLSVLDRYFQVRCTLDRDESYGATAAGLLEVWHVYLSGTGITEAPCTEGNKSKEPGIALEWRLAVSHDGLMEFTSV